MSADIVKLEGRQARGSRGLGGNAIVAVSFAVAWSAHGRRWGTDSSIASIAAAERCHADLNGQPRTITVADRLRWSKSRFAPRQRWAIRSRPARRC